MRRKDREITDPGRLKEILENSMVCRLAVQDQEGLYIVPMNFGYEWDKDGLKFYFHSAKEGRKLNAILENPQVCFEMDFQHRLIESDRVCGYSFSYQSMIGNGIATVVKDLEEKKKGLFLLMKHQTGKDFPIQDEMADSVAVIRVAATSYTGKQHGPIE